MVRIGISVEGQTEERFIKLVLGPYLTDKGIDIVPISINGNVSISRIKSELKKIARNFDFVTTFYDFYGFKNKANNENKESLEERIKESVHQDLPPVSA